MPMNPKIKIATHTSPSESKSGHAGVDRYHGSPNSTFFAPPSVAGSHGTSHDENTEPPSDIDEILGLLESPRSNTTTTTSASSNANGLSPTGFRQYHDSSVSRRSVDVAQQAMLSAVDHTSGLRCASNSQTVHSQGDRTPRSDNSSDHNCDTSLPSVGLGAVDSSLEALIYGADAASATKHPSKGTPPQAKSQSPKRTPKSKSNSNVSSHSRNKGYHGSGKFLTFCSAVCFYICTIAPTY
jgi:hypothetical protein